MRTVTSIRGRPSSASGIDLDADDAAVLLLPDRPHAEQRQDLGHVVAVGAHGAGAPDADADRLGIGARLGAVALEHLAGQLLPDLPGGRRRQGARIDGVEVAARRQDVSHAARRRPARPGRDVAPVQAGQQIGRSRRSSAAAPAPGARRRRPAPIAQTRLRTGRPTCECRRGTSRRRCTTRRSPIRRSEARRRCKQRRAGAGTGRRWFPGRRPGVTSGRSARRASAGGTLSSGRPRSASSVVEVETEQAGHGGAQAGHVEVGHARQRLEQADHLLALGHLSQDVQAVADLRPGQLAQVAVQFLDQVRHLPAAHLGQRHRRAVGGDGVVPFVGVAVLALLHQIFQIVFQVGLLDQVPDLLLQQRHLRRVEQLDLVILVHQLHQLGQLAVGVGRGHRRRQVVDDDGVAAPLGLRPSPGSLRMNG